MIVLQSTYDKLNHRLYVLQEEIKMKQAAKVIEVEGKGIVSLMGENITIFSLNYIYTGKLIGVDDDDILLQDARIVYATGSFSDRQWKDAQELAEEWYVPRNCIESYGILDKV
jgi:hypothetical protein